MSEATNLRFLCKMFWSLLFNLNIIQVKPVPGYRIIPGTIPFTSQKKMSGKFGKFPHEVISKHNLKQTNSK